MRRYVRVDGAPDKIEYSAEPAPPEKLYEVLFQELCQIDIRKMTITREVSEPREGRIARGFFGTELAGVRWLESHATMAPLHVTHVSYGLPNMELYWQYQWHSGGHAPSTYTHSRLEVAFEDDSAVERFTRIWQQVFGQAPSLIDLPPEAPETLEKRLIYGDRDPASADLMLARDLATPPETLAQLAKRSSDLSVLYRIAANPRASGHVLMAVWQHPHVVATREAVEPLDKLAALYWGSDDDFLERLEFAIAGHPNTPPDFLTVLANSTDPNLRAAVKRNPHFQPAADEDT